MLLSLLLARSPLFLALSRSLPSSLLSLSLLSLFMYAHILMAIAADVERGMAEEHLLQPDSNEGFTSSNYAVRSRGLVSILHTEV